MVLMHGYDAVQLVVLLLGLDDKSNFSNIVFTNTAMSDSKLKFVSHKTTFDRLQMIWIAIINISLQIEVFADVSIQCMGKIEHKGHNYNCLDELKICEQQKGCIFIEFTW